MKARPINVFFGVLHLLGARYWTPPQHREAFDRWPEGPLAADDDVREVLDHWAEQQHVAWALARGLAWRALLGLARLLLPGM